ncbi:hypothetical protein CCR75_009248 [Bremia lactucae]|uniref:Ankyrin repeat protein n=1 Tax=Bremia lactucae TaxID=4779 RepID=A0A976IDI2_BRELC|nr:hypothetical protein CCR75_009248 [Bremia lactucae]
MAMSPPEIVSKLTKILETHLPAEMSSLEHVMELIDDLLMAPKKALIKAAANNNVERLEHLLQSYNFDLVDAISSASASGHVDVIHRLMHDIREREQARIRAERSESDDSSDDNNSDDEDEDESNRIEIHDALFRYIEVAVTIAATNGQVEIVRTFLPQTVGSGENEEAFVRMNNLTWQTIDEGAANGHFNVVQFAVEFAKEWGFVDQYIASPNSDALLRAVENGHDKVAMYLLEIDDIDWDLKRAYEKGIEVQRLGLVEWIYALSSMYNDDVFP